MKNSFAVALGALALQARSALAQAPAASSSAAAPPPNPNADLIRALKTAPNNVAKLDLLQSSDYVFDYNFPPRGSKTGTDNGYLIGANAGTWPALIGQGVAIAVGSLGPCTMNAPHTHPRATELVYIINGTFTVGAMPENGGQFIQNTITQGQSTFFPMGSIHYAQNLGCETTMFIATFSSEDPGTLSVAQRYFSMPADILGSSWGGLGVEQVDGLEALIPDNPTLGADACLRRCGLTRPNPPTTTQHAREQPPADSYTSSPPQATLYAIGAGPNPDGPSVVPVRTLGASINRASATAAASTAAANQAAASPSATSGIAGIQFAPLAGPQAPQGQAQRANNLAALSSSGSSGGLADSKALPIVIALAVVNGVLVLAVLAALGFALWKRKRAPEAGEGPNGRSFKVMSHDRAYPQRSPPHERRYASPGAGGSTGITNPFDEKEYGRSSESIVRGHRDESDEE